VKALAFDAAGKRLATGDSQGTVRIWDLATNATVRSLTGHNNEINALAFSPDGTRLAAAANCQDVRVWNAETGDEVSKSVNHPGPVKCVAFSPDGSRLATGSDDDAVRLIDASSGQLVKSFFGCNSGIESVAFLPDGNRLMAVGHNDTHIRIWEIATGRQLKPLSTPSSSPWLKGFVVSPNGRSVAGRDFGGTVFVWETESGRRVGGFSMSGGGSGHSTLAFAPDGSLIATVDWPDVKIRDVSTGRVACTFKGHTGTIQSVAISPEGSHVVSSGTDNTVRMWEVPAAFRRARPVTQSDTASPPAELEISVPESPKPETSQAGDEKGPC
jgi:WD40 repeat protein